MAELLVSVRSAAEAAIALAGGAGLIDVKEPGEGSLGRAADATIGAVCQIVGDRRPVSAACGELLEKSPPLQERRLAFAKWGLAGCLRDTDWPTRLNAAARRQQAVTAACQPVVVCYADWHAAQAPHPDAVCAFSCRQRPGAFLIDTWAKDGRTLLDHLSLKAITRLRQRCRAAGVPVALAGSLASEQIRRLESVEPDWFAVRGAACRKRCRTGIIDPERVRRLVHLVRMLSRATAAAGS